MPDANTKEARLNFRLSTDLKAVIGEAATAMGQSVSDYAVATLVATSHAVLQQNQTTSLSKRDRKVFLAMLDRSGAKPKRALTEAAKRYKKRIK